MCEPGGDPPQIYLDRVVLPLFGTVAVKMDGRLSGPGNKIAAAGRGGEYDAPDAPSAIISRTIMLGGSSMTVGAAIR